VLTTDVAGYSRPIDADEVGTAAVFVFYRREVVDPAVRHHGELN
jgi:hypothetical protein